VYASHQALILRSLYTYVRSNLVSNINEFRPNPGIFFLMSVMNKLGTSVHKCYVINQWLDLLKPQLNHTNTYECYQGNCLLQGDPGVIVAISILPRIRQTCWTRKLGKSSIISHNKRQFMIVHYLTALYEGPFIMFSFSVCSVGSNQTPWATERLRLRFNAVQHTATAIAAHRGASLHFICIITCH
jgi:hypothetical protein